MKPEHLIEMPSNSSYVLKYGRRKNIVDLLIENKYLVELKVGKLTNQRTGSIHHSLTILFQNSKVFDKGPDVESLCEKDVVGLWSLRNSGYEAGWLFILSERVTYQDIDQIRTWGCFKRQNQPKCIKMDDLETFQIVGIQVF